MIGFAANKTTLKLSELIIGTAQGRRSSCRRDEIHIISDNTTAILRYSASVLLRETTFCLWEFQEIMLFPR